MTDDRCWNDYCIAGDCDGVSHVDATGSTWKQKRGTVYSPATGGYDPPERDETEADGLQAGDEVVFEFDGVEMVGTLVNLDTAVGSLLNVNDPLSEVKLPNGRTRYPRRGGVRRLTEDKGGQ